MSDREELLKIIEYMQNGPPKPPWKPPGKARFETYRRAMIDFVGWHLRRLPIPLIVIDPDHDPKRHVEWLKNFGPEIDKARRGDIEPLRKKLPHLAEFSTFPRGRW